MPGPDPESKAILERAKEVANIVYFRVCEMLDEVCDTTDGSPLEVTAAEWLEITDAGAAVAYEVTGKLEGLEDDGKIVIVG